VALTDGFMATWESEFSIDRREADGSCWSGGVKLPPLADLERRAQAIADGVLLRERLGPERYQEFRDRVAEDPGYVEVTGVGQHPGMRWSIRFQPGGEYDGRGFHTGKLSAAHALAWMIAACEEHEREVRAELLEHVGGLA
jgi:hypothetical protein